MPLGGECGGWRVSRGKALSHATKYLIILMVGGGGGKQPARHQLPLCCHVLHTLLLLVRFSRISKGKILRVLVICTLV
jgi:hypothetical protein